MLGGADALRYSVGVATHPRTLRAWRRAARPWLYLAPALLLYGPFAPSALDARLA